MPIKKAGPGRPRGRKKKGEVLTPVSREFVPSSDSDSSPERSKKKALKALKTPKTPKTPKMPKIPKSAPEKKQPITTPVHQPPKPQHDPKPQYDPKPQHDPPPKPTPQPPPIKKPPPEPEPPVELNVDITSIASPDPKILPDNPLIPRFFGFGNINKAEPSSSSSKEVSEPVMMPVIPKKESISSKSESTKDSKSKDSSEKESKKEKKKDKSLKKAKKEKKEKNRDKEKKKEEKEAKAEKKEKEKKKKKEKEKDKEKPSSPILFAGTDQKTTTSGPKLKIKDFKDAPASSSSIQPPPAPPPPAAVASISASEGPKSSPKIVFKNFGDSSSTKKKDHAPKQVDIFSDPIHIDRPKSAASDTSDPGKKSLKDSKKEKKESSSSQKQKSDESSRKRPISGNSGNTPSSKREKRESAVAAQSAMQPVSSAAPEEKAGQVEAGAPKFSGVSAVVQESVGYYVDAEGNQIWICPACGKPDDGSPMIGCDECDDWYHWICVGIQQEPADNQDWFCPRCVQKKTSMYIERKTPGKRGRPPKR